MLLLLALTAPAQSQTVKGLYVDNFSNILGDIPAEDSLLNYAQTNGFNYLALYELHLVHAQYDMTNFSSIAPLAAFINRAKTQYGIQQVGAVAENYWFFLNRVHVYNQAHPNVNEKFDVYNLEFEFWIAASTGPSSYYFTTYLQPGGYPCDTSGAFQFYKSELRQIDSLANTIGKISETYVGWPTVGQCHQISALTDRVLVHAYVTNDNVAYGYTQTRLSYFGTAAAPTDIIVIFSSESAFMGPWLASNQEAQAYTTYSADFAAETAGWTSGINLIGYQWFAYTFMPYDLSLATDPEQLVVHFLVTSQNNTLQITCTNDETKTCKIYNALGETVSSTKQTASNFSVPMNSCATGIYFVEIQNTTTGEVNSKKIIYTAE